MVMKPAVAILMIAMTSPILSQQQRQVRYELAAQQIAAAVRHELIKSGVEVTEDEISLPARIVATEPAPLFEINSVEKFSGYEFEGRIVTRSKIKLSCRVTSACLPFYAIVSWKGAAGESSAKAFLPSSLESLAPKSKVTMSAGTPATLVMGDENIHIQLKVVSLESGPRGGLIRVASPDHKTVYVAEIVSANLVRGRF
jgi:hypothetical protein